MLDRIKIVLVETSHPGNIGSAARAMKTMGLTQLVLVSPLKFPHQQAIEMASGAMDLLENAEIYPTLLDAVADCELVIGSSARTREIALPQLEMRTFAPYIAQQASDARVAIVFGRERTGLTNDELSKCQFQVTVDTNPEYGSLNLAQAVQLFCYELRAMAMSNQVHAKSEGSYNKMAQVKEIEGLYQHIEQTLHLTEFLDPEAPKKVMAKIKRLFSRTRLEAQEVNILRGILSSVQHSIENKK